MSITIEGKAKVWAKDFDGRTVYSISIGSKDQEGRMQYAYQPVRFRKGEKVENGTLIDFRAFPSVSIGKEKNRLIWQILEFRRASDDMASPKPEDQYTQLTNDDIPF